MLNVTPGRRSARHLETTGRPIYPAFTKNIPALSFKKPLKSSAQSPPSYDFNILVDFIEKLNPCEEEMCFQRSA